MEKNNNIHLRPLQMEDAPLMLEWMHDDNVVRDLATQFNHKTIDDCIKFITIADEQNRNLKSCQDIHMAIASISNEYLGTVSLKNIDRKAKTAEFAIALRSSAMGKGYGKSAMNEMINIGFKDKNLGIDKIYWCVNKNNTRARNFYDKQNYKTVEADEAMLKNYKAITKASELIWYSILRCAEVEE